MEENRFCSALCHAGSSSVYASVVCYPSPHIWGNVFLYSSLTEVSCFQPQDLANTLNGFFSVCGFHQPDNCRMMPRPHCEGLVLTILLNTYFLCTAFMCLGILPCTFWKHLFSFWGPAEAHDWCIAEPRGSIWGLLQDHHCTDFKDLTQLLPLTWASEWLLCALDRNARKDDLPLCGRASRKENVLWCVSALKKLQLLLKISTSSLWALAHSLAYSTWPMC